jgi:hypothetical protein
MVETKGKVCLGTGSIINWEHIYDFLGTSWVLPGYFLGTSWVLPGYFLGNYSLDYPGSLESPYYPGS